MIPEEKEEKEGEEYNIEKEKLDDVEEEEEEQERDDDELYDRSGAPPFQTWVMLMTGAKGLKRSKESLNGRSEWQMLFRLGATMSVWPYQLIHMKKDKFISHNRYQWQCAFFMYADIN